MAIIINDNFAVNVGKPVDSKYLNTGTTRPWVSVSAANAGIPQSYRYSGLTVLIQSGVTNVEYWYLNGITNGDLVQKKFATIIPLGDFVTGGTNLGYFNGPVGIQILPIAHSTCSCYSGNYCSLYNYYVRGTDCKIHIDIPSDGIPRRGYVKTSVNPGEIKSWVWNEVNNYSLGWILIDGNIANCIGGNPNAVPYYPPSTPHIETGYTAGVAYPSASYVDICTVIGNLSGCTLSIGGPVYACMAHNNLHFRTLYTCTPNLIKITNDEAFVYLSGTTGNQLLTASNGLTKVGQDVRLGGTITGTTTLLLTGSSTLIATDCRVTPVGIQYGADYSASFTPRSLVDRGYVDSRSVASGERIVKTICQPSHGFSVDTVIGWSGGSYNRAIANGTYDGEVLGLVTCCYNVDCFDLTQAGYVSGLTGLITNTTYFLSATVPGLLTSVEPSTPNYLSKAVLIANSSVSGWVLPYAAYVISSGITEGGALIKSVCLPSISTYLMQNTDFFVGMSGGTTVFLPISPKTGMVVVVADISNTALSYPITIVGSVVGCTSTSQIDTNSGSLSYIYNGSRWNVFAFAPALA